MNYLGAMVLIATLGLAMGAPAAMGLDGSQQMQAMGYGMDGAGHGACTCAQAGHGMMAEHSHQHHHMADHDGDGIPNCQDEDWAPPEDGTGHRHQGSWS